MSIHSRKRWRNKMMKHSIKRAAVIGSGVMGSSIAAHLANVGIQTIMLDIVPQELTAGEREKGLTLEHLDVRNRIALQGKQSLLKQKPSPITTKESLELIEVGNLTDDLPRVSEVDWIIEVVVENLEVKKDIFAKIEKHWKKGTIISSNTSGISLHDMVENCSEEFRKHFLGTHFFNPPRYLKLLEVIPTKDTDPEVLADMKTFGEDRLGKGVVEAKDTPNSIANRIGTYGLLVTVQEMLNGDYTVGEVDSVTGTLIGRPKSATFRTLDVVGLDTFIHVAKNVYDQVEGKEKDVFDVPSFMLKMKENGWLGQKSGRGFYVKEKGEAGSVIYQLNPDTLTYENQSKLKTAATEMAKQAKGIANKMKALVYAEGDRAGDFVWSITKPILIYAAELVGEIADDIISIDQAMCWGFGWKKGPFEIWDAIGLERSVERMVKEGENVPEWILTMIEDGHTSFYQVKNNQHYYYHDQTYKKQTTNEKEIDLQHLKNIHGVVKKNAGASLIDLGDGVAGLEFHSRGNSLGLDSIQMINYAIDEVNKNYEGLVIGNQGRHFCVGANLALMLMEAQDDNFFELDIVVRQFQDMAMNIKYSEKPVVVAPFNMTLGGGAEVSLPAAALQASSETYIGLVEFGVGLIPGGGGTKELYLKKLRNLPKGIQFDLTKVANDVFEKVAMEQVSTSGAEALENGYMDHQDCISNNREHLMYDDYQQII